MVARLLVFAALQFLLGCATTSSWVGTWSAAPQLTEPANMPPAPGLAGNTLRQTVHVSLGGERIRVKFSNAFGDAPLTIRSAQIADRALTFGGKAGTTIPTGATVVSDELPFVLRPLSDVTITINFGDVPPKLTGHPGSRTTSILMPGDVRTIHWYVITGIDVVTANRGSVVVLGNSITDGRGSGTDRQNRWPDELARRLQADPRTARIAVLNQGIGGNCVLRACLGPSALDRFERDVLNQSGVRWLIVLEGVNDIGGAKDSATAAGVARDLIAAYRTMIVRAHARGIRVFGATIMPFGGSFYDSPEREAARSAVNQWIRTGGEFDGVVDTDAALRDPQHPTRLLPAADTGDHLHPNELGHRMIAEAVDLRLFSGGPR